MVFNFGMLFIFKYINFFIEIINTAAGTKIFDSVAITLPLGISFYTFQITSYIFDVYRLKYQADKSIIKFGTYVSMFPQLIAGPIVNYDEVKPELDHREVKADDIERGATLFVLGLAYKVLLANKIASLWNDVQTVGPYGINTVTAWLGSWGYSFQLLFDFMGYSVMAIGIGLILGFRIPENFVDPYMAHSLTDFWRRWHVTLGRWFREYVSINGESANQAVSSVLRFLTRMGVIRYNCHAGYISTIMDEEDLLSIRSEHAAGFFKKLVQPGDEVVRPQRSLYMRTRYVWTRRL